MKNEASAEVPKTALTRIATYKVAPKARPQHPMLKCPTSQRMETCLQSGTKMSLVSLANLFMTTVKGKGQVMNNN